MKFLSTPPTNQTTSINLTEPTQPIDHGRRLPGLLCGKPERDVGGRAGDAADGRHPDGHRDPVVGQNGPLLRALLLEGARWRHVSPVAVCVRLFVSCFLGVIALSLEDAGL